MTCTHPNIQLTVSTVDAAENDALPHCADCGARIGSCTICSAAVVMPEGIPPGVVCGKCMEPILDTIDGLRYPPTSTGGA